MAEWKAFTGRISLFPTSPPLETLPSANDLYRTIWESDPDNFHKAEHALASAIAQGKRGVIMATCTVHPTRMDINLGAAQATEGQMATQLPLIEDFAALASEMERVINAVGRLPGKLPRVALFTQFLSIQPTVAEANKKVVRVIPREYGVSVVHDEEDLVFQLNRPYFSKAIQNLKMNSVVKWSVERIQMMALQMPGPGSLTNPQGAFLPPRIFDFTAGSVGIDINNMPTFPLSGAQQVELLAEGQAESMRVQQELGLTDKTFPQKGTSSAKLN
jgi:hypothetical protein